MLLYFNFFFACRNADKNSDNSSIIEIIDEDGDGFGAEEDCDDQNPDTYPEAVEICDGEDNNCNNEIDEGMLQFFFQDSDADGFGNGEEQVEACESPEGYVEDNTDCNDSSNESFTGAPEICDGDPHEFPQQQVCAGWTEEEGSERR